MTAAERLRAMAQGHGHCVVPRGVLRDIANQAEKESQYVVCTKRSQSGPWLTCSRCGAFTRVTDASKDTLPRYCGQCGAWVVDE